MKLRKGTKRIVFIGILIIAVIFMFSNIHIKIVKSMMENETNQHLREITIQSATNISNLLNTTLCKLAVLARNEQFIPTQLDQHTLIERLHLEVIGNRTYRMGLVQLNGDAVTTDGKQFNVFDDRMWFSEAKQNKKIIEYIKTDKDTSNAEPIVIYAVPMTENNRVTQVLFSVEQAEQVAQLLNFTFFDGSGYAYIIDNKGDVLINLHQRQEKNIITAVSQTPNKTLTADKVLAALNDKNMFSDKVFIDGLLQYITIAPIQTVDNWSLLTIVPSHIASKRSSTILRQTFLLLAFIMIGSSAMVIYIIHITQRNEIILQEKNAQIKENERKYRTVLTATSEYIFDFDIIAQKLISGAHNFYTGDTDYYTFIHFFSTQYVHTEDRASFLNFASIESIKSAVSHQDSELLCELRMLTASQIYRWMSVTIVPIYISKGEAAHIICFIKNIDERKRNELAMLDKSQQDSLTGLFNKATTQSLIETYLMHEGKNACHALMIIDLDNFKGINDCMGHLQGDAVLSAVGKNLKSIIRSSDIAGRVGGDEFIVFFKDITPDRALQKAEEIINSFKNISTYAEQHMIVSGTIGIAWYPTNGENLYNLYDAADKALYFAKKRGKDCYATYEQTHY